MNLKKDQLINTVLPVFILLVVTTFFHTRMNLVSGDAEVFSNALNDQSLFTFLYKRYTTWTSRVIIEAVLVGVIKVPLLWHALDILAVLCIFWALLKIANFFGASSSSSWALLVLMLAYPYATLSEAGWVPTTTNSEWPLACALVVIAFLLKNLQGNSLSLAKRILIVPLTLYASNSEQTAFVLWFVLLAITVYCFINKRSFGFQLGLLIVVSCACVFLLACPGNAARSAYETEYWWPNSDSAAPFDIYANFGLLEKIYIGFTTTMDGYLYGYFAGICMLPACYALFLCVRLFTTKSPVALKALSLVPLTVLWFVPLSGFAHIAWPEALAPFLTRPIFDASFTRTVVSVVELLVVVILAIGTVVVFNSYDFAGNSGAGLDANSGVGSSDSSSASSASSASFMGWILLGVLGVCFASRLVLGFSPTVFASGYRVNLFLDTAFILLSVILCSRVKKSVPKAALVLVIFCGLVALYTMKHALGNLTLWA